jgi:hypothetical protein
MVFQMHADRGGGKQFSFTSGPETLHELRREVYQLSQKADIEVRNLARKQCRV